MQNMTSEEMSSYLATFSMEKATRPNVPRVPVKKRRRERRHKKLRTLPKMRKLLERQLKKNSAVRQPWTYLLGTSVPVAVLVRDGFLLPDSVPLDLDNIMSIVNATVVAYCGGQARNSLYEDAYADERFNLPRGIRSAILYSVMNLHELWNLFVKQFAM